MITFKLDNFLPRLWDELVQFERRKLCKKFTRFNSELSDQEQMLISYGSFNQLPSKIKNDLIVNKKMIHIWHIQLQHDKRTNFSR